MYKACIRRNKRQKNIPSCCVLSGEVGGGLVAAVGTVDCCCLPAAQYTHAFSVSSEQSLQNYNGDLTYIGTGLVR